MTGADLTGADLSDADVEEINVSGSTIKDTVTDNGLAQSADDFRKGTGPATRKGD